MSKSREETDNKDEKPTDNIVEVPKTETQTTAQSEANDINSITVDNFVGPTDGDTSLGVAATGEDSHCCSCVLF